MNRFLPFLETGDLRSIARANQAAERVQNQADFDELMACLSDGRRLVVMRAADAVEKVTRMQPHYLQPHRKTLLALRNTATDKELIWHLAQLLPRLKLTGKERQQTWQALHGWAINRAQSRIVRVNALQGLTDLALQYPAFRPELHLLFGFLEQERVPSLSARIRKLRTALAHA